VSEAAAATASDALGGSYRIIPNAVDVAGYRAATPWPSDGRAVLFLGRHEERKGLGVLLEAFAMLSAGGRVPDAELWVAGDGPQTSALRARYADLPGCRWLGVVTEEEKRRQQEILDARIAAADALISTAAVPGRPAPKIITRAAAERMRPGSVIVDLAAEQGGNCELTRAGETVVHQGVRIIGPVNLPADLAYNASEMYARNLLNFLSPAIKQGELAIDWEDEVFAKACLTHGGQIRHEPTRQALSG
jgi:glycosyltransferase involved in cell wall biosynthesis